jgi:hypothetical protein
VLEYSFSRLESLSIAGDGKPTFNAAPRKTVAGSDRSGVRALCQSGARPQRSPDPLHREKASETAMSIELSTTAVPGQVKTIGKSRIWIDSVETERFVCKATDGGK